MKNSARLLVPAIRWDAATGYAGQRAQIETALDHGVGGFILFGGEVAAVKELTAELRERSSFPLLIASDLERGAGQQFRGAAGLPPLAALGASMETGVASRSARLTATEALGLGVNWILAPVCDLDLAMDNPIVGTRSPGQDVEHVSTFISEWIDACQSAGALSCAKHFPGHGRTPVDSHATLPVVETTAAELTDSDLAPFRAAIEAGVASVLTAHIAFPDLDPSGMPATLSRPILTGWLREKMRFDGIIVTDAMIMEGVLRGRSEEDACVAALHAGCDLVLYPLDIPRVARAVAAALKSGALDVEQIHRSLERRDRWASWASSPAAEVPAEQRAWADKIAERSLVQVRGHLLAVSSMLDVLVVDDDIGGPYPAPSREPFFSALRSSGVDARVIDTPSGDGRRTLLIALFGDIRSWKGRAGYSAASLNAVSRALARDSSAIVLQFSHPRLASEIPEQVPHVVSAWGGEEVMQRAAARWLLERIHE